MGILALVSAAAALVTPPLRVSPRAHVCANANAKVTFEEAQDLGSNLASILAESCAAGEPMPAEAVSTLRALVSSTPGARGWFVSLLTNPDYDAVFQLPLDEALLSAIESSPDPNLKLLTMNVAMSTATELVHLANGNPDLAAASALTRARSGVLLGVLHGRMPGLSDEVASLLSAVQPWSADGAAPAGADAEWVVTFWQALAASTPELSARSASECEARWAVLASGAGETSAGATIDVGRQPLVLEEWTRLEGGRISGRLAGQPSAVWLTVAMEGRLESDPREEPGFIEAEQRERAELRVDRDKAKLQMMQQRIKEDEQLLSEYRRVEAQRGGDADAVRLIFPDQFGPGPGIAGGGAIPGSK